MDNYGEVKLNAAMKWIEELEEFVRGYCCDEEDKCDCWVCRAGKEVFNKKPEILK